MDRAEGRRGCGCARQTMEPPPSGLRPGISAKPPKFARLPNLPAQVAALTARLLAGVTFREEIERYVSQQVAVAAPMPVEAPVMKRVLSVMSVLSRLSGRQRGGDAAGWCARLESRERSSQ